MRILIIGGGAIGRMLFDRFSVTAHKATLIARKPVAERIRSGFSLVSTPHYTHGLLSGPVFETITEAFADRMHYDLIVIAVKSYDTAKVAEGLALFVTSKTTVLTVQNGIGNEATLKEALPRVPILAGVLTTPVEVVSDKEIRITTDRFWVGLAEHTPYALTELTRCTFEKAGFTAKVLLDARSLKWSKLLMNNMGNATSAILGWTPAQVFADRRLGALEMEMVREALTVMRGLGIPVVPIGGKPLPHLASFVRLAPIWLSRQVVGRLVVKGRDGKMPSLYHDVHPTPRGKSEVSWLNGAVAREAGRLGIPAPVNATFADIVSKLASGAEPPDNYRNNPTRLLGAVIEARSALSSPERS